MSNDYPDGLFDSAKVRLPDGRIAYDAVKLASLPTEGLFLKDHPNCVVKVRTRNTTYTLTNKGGQVTAIAVSNDGGEPRYLKEESNVIVHGSTYGGSMLKMDYVGIGMHLEMYVNSLDKTLLTSAIESIALVPVA